MPRLKRWTLFALAIFIPSTSYVAWAMAQTPATNTTDQATATASELWVASAPGRVEPKGGTFRIGASLNSRITSVLVTEGQKVARGDTLIQLDDDGAISKFVAAKIEAIRTKKVRDDAGGGDRDYRGAEDDLTDAELAFWNARDALDRANDRRHGGPGYEGDVTAARKSYVAAENALKAKYNALIDLQNRKARPNPNQQESALATARASQALAAALVERTHIRAPIDGVALKVDAKSGQIIAPSPDQVLVTLGDTSHLQVKAEVEERDVGHIKVGQLVTVRCEAFSGQDFSAHVSAISPALALPELGANGPGRLNDVDVLEATVELDEKTPLLPGLRVDVFFKDTTSPTGPAASSAATGASTGTAGSAAGSPDTTTATKP
jgi:HlyD family secretion protein